MVFLVIRPSIGSHFCFRLLTWKPDRHVSYAQGPQGSSSPEFDDYVPNSDGRPNGSIHPDAAFSEQIVFCVVQSELVDAVTSTVLGTKRNSEEVILSIPSSKSKYINGFDSNESIHNGLFNTMNPILLLSLCDALGESQRLAKQFNDNNGQRTLLWKAGLRGSSKPNLIRQETHALRAMLAILLRLLNDPRSECVWDQVTKGVLSVVSAVLRGYGEATSDARRTAYAPVVCELLQECLHLPAHLLPSLGSEFPLHLCELVETAEGQPLRSLLATLLRQFLLAKNASSTKRNSSHGINVEVEQRKDSFPDSSILKIASTSDISFDAQEIEFSDGSHFLRQYDRNFLQPSSLACLWERLVYNETHTHGFISNRPSPFRV